MHIILKWPHRILKKNWMLFKQGSYERKRTALIFDCKSCTLEQTQLTTCLALPSEICCKKLTISVMCTASTFWILIAFGTEILKVIYFQNPNFQNLRPMQKKMLLTRSSERLECCCPLRLLALKWLFAHFSGRFF